jgi:hypothetical protein
MSIKSQVKNAMLKCIAKAKKEYRPNARSEVIKIKGTNSYTNSINVLISIQGGGKTFQSLNEAIAISHIMQETHLIVLFSKKEHDETVAGITELSPVPIVVIPYDQAQEFMIELIDAKHLYRKLHHEIYEFENGGEDEIIDGQELDNMADVLCIDDLNRSWLQTIIILDDVGGSNLFNKESSAFNNWLRLSRDLNIIWFLNLHSITQLPPSIRSNASVLYASKNLSPERMSIIHHQTNSGISWEEFKDGAEHLKSMPNARWLVIDCLENNCHIE